MNLTTKQRRAHKRSVIRRDAFQWLFASKKGHDALLMHPTRLTLRSKKTLGSTCSISAVENCWDQGNLKITGVIHQAGHRRVQANSITINDDRFTSAPHSPSSPRHQVIRDARFIWRPKGRRTGSAPFFDETWMFHRKIPASSQTAGLNWT